MLSNTVCCIYKKNLVWSTLNRLHRSIFPHNSDTQYGDGGSIEFRSKQINFEVVLGIRECVLKCKDVGHVNLKLRLQHNKRLQEFEINLRCAVLWTTCVSKDVLDRAHQWVRTLLLRCCSSSNDSRRKLGGNAKVRLECPSQVRTGFTNQQSGYSTFRGCCIECLKAILTAGFSFLNALGGRWVRLHSLREWLFRLTRRHFNWMVQRTGLIVRTDLLKIRTFVSTRQWIC